MCYVVLGERGTSSHAVDHATTRTMQGSSFTRGSSLAALAETDAAAPRIQLVEIQGSGSHSKFCVPVGGANVFSVPPKSPGLAQAYLQECCRRVPALPWVDLVVVLDGMRPICFGPPTGWDLGVAARVQRSQLETGILRVFRPGCMIDSKMLASAAAHGRPGGSSSNAPAAALSEGVGPSSSSAAVRGSAADRDPLASWALWIPCQDPGSLPQGWRIVRSRRMLTHGRCVSRPCTTWQRLRFHWRLRRPWR